MVFLIFLIMPNIKSWLMQCARTFGISFDVSHMNIFLLTLNLQAVPSKGVCRQFEIDSNEHDEFDVANELWSLMEGKQPALTC